MVKICEPCVVRCHSGHKGVRLIRNSQALCICSHVCRVTHSTCNAQTISKSQMRVQKKAIAAREELERMRQRNIDMPPVFGMVPRNYFDGTPKRESGWMICRLCANSAPSTGSRTKDDGSLMIGKHGDDASLEEAGDLSDSDGSMQSLSNTSLNSMGTLETTAEEESKQSKRSNQSKLQDAPLVKQATLLLSCPQTAPCAWAYQLAGWSSTTWRSLWC